MRSWQVFLSPAAERKEKGAGPEGPAPLEPDLYKIFLNAGEGSLV